MSLRRWLDSRDNRDGLEGLLLPKRASVSPDTGIDGEVVGSGEKLCLFFYGVLGVGTPNRSRQRKRDCVIPGIIRVYYNVRGKSVGVYSWRTGYAIGIFAMS